MKILAIDTATEACSAAVLCDGAILERYRIATRDHNRLILPMVESVLEEAGLAIAQLDALAFGCGPGSFTGVRIAAGVIQGIAFAADLPVIRVSTLAALAQEGLDETKANWAYACIDARMGEVYWGVYGRAGGPGGYAELCGQEAVLPADRVPCPPDSRGVGSGSGWSAYGSVLRGHLGDRVEAVLPDRFPRAAKIVRLGAEGFRRGVTVPAEGAVPVYLRDNVARKPAIRSG